MDFDEYQRKAAATAIYPTEVGVVYTALGLASEAGEVAGKVKKVLRDENGDFDLQAAYRIADEMGDVLWYMAQLATELGVPLASIASGNIAKLASRSERGVLGGSGDER